MSGHSLLPHGVFAGGIITGKRQWILPIVAPLKSVLRELLVSALVVNVLALVTPIFTMQVYDRVITHNGMETLKALAMGVLIVLVFDFVLRIARSRIMQTVALKLDVEVGRKLFDKVMALPLRTLESRPTAFWHQLFRDVDTVRNTLSGATAILMTDLPFLFLFLGVIYMIGRPLVLVFIALLVGFFVLAWASGRTLAGSGKREASVAGARDSLVAEIIAARAMIKSTGLDRVMKPLWEERQAAAIEHAIRRGAISDGFQVIGSSMTQMGTIAMTTLGAVAIIGQDLSMGSLIACNMLSGRLYGPIAQLVGAWRTYGGFVQALDRLGEIFNLPEDRKVSAVALERPKGVIAVEGVVFGFEKGRAPTVTAERLVFNPGGISAILGRNGSGKTTLLKIIMGLYHPDKGRVLIDGADIAQFSHAELAHWIGFVPQECILFNGTIRDNIAHGAPDCTDDELVAASKAAGVHHLVVDMPDGYATQIGEGGARLSAGTRQRIAIARALVGNPAVLLLDEPSSSLDRQAEEELRTTLANLAKDRTVIVVTHSPVLLPACMALVVLEKGLVAAAGPASELLPLLFKPREPVVQPSTVTPLAGRAP